MNPIIIALAIMLALSMSGINVIIALIAGAILAGISSGMTFISVSEVFANGLGNGAHIALSYALLGAFAAGLSSSELPDALTGLIQKLASRTTKQKYFKYVLLLCITVLAIASQNLIPIHIAFIPLLIPPLLPLLTHYQVDRRAIVCCITFGITATYMIIPFGFGELFMNQIVKGALRTNGLSDVDAINLPQAMILPISGMLLGLLIAIFISYRKPRIYRTKTNKNDNSPLYKNKSVSTLNCWKGVLAIVAMIASQIYTESMIMGALAGCTILLLLRVVSLKKANQDFIDGIKMMAFCGIVMIAAAGFAEVIRMTGAVDTLVLGITDWIHGSRAIGALAMLVVGLLITMGLGSSFSTVPIIATLYVPLGLELGFSPTAIAVLVSVAGGLGDAGSPTSDSTLGPTAVLNMDNQHDHIFDSVIPTFLHYNIPLLILGWSSAMIL